LAEFYGNIGGGTSVSDLTSSDKYINGMPDNVRPVYLAETPTDIADNFGWRMLGLITAPVTGDYAFHIAADDSSELWLSTDETPANLGAGPIAYFNGWGSARQWDPPESQGSGQQHSNPMRLTAGQKYYFMALSKEGGGGDNLAVGWTYPGVATTNVIPGQYLSAWVNPDLSIITISTQPANLTVLENRTATFAIAATGVSEFGPGLNYQWQKNGTDIAGATAASYTTALLTLADNGTKFKVVLKVPAKTVISDEVTLTVLADPVAPNIASVKGDAVKQSSVTVVFDELVSSASAAAAANYAIAGPGGAISITSAQLMADGKTVILKTAALTVGTRYTLTVNNVKDVATTPNTIAANSKADFIAVGAYKQAADGLTVFEAEGYSGIASPVGGSDWLFRKDLTAYSGDGFMVAWPDSGRNVNTGYAANSPRLDFEVNFIKTGTYHVWVRGAGPDGGGDSMHSGLDGAELASADRISGSLNNGLAGWVWTRDTMDNAPASFTVADAGIHTVNIWMREDGLRVDKIVITLDVAYNPSTVNNGLGPDASEREGVGVVPVVGKFDSIERVGKDVVIKWSGGGVLQSADNIKGPWTDVTGATSPLTIQPTEAVKFYQLRSQ
jgi:hypothetical protein